LRGDKGRAIRMIIGGEWAEGQLRSARGCRGG